MTFKGVPTPTLTTNWQDSSGSCLEILMRDKSLTLNACNENSAAQKWSVYKFANTPLNDKYAGLLCNTSTGLQNCLSVAAMNEKTSTTMYPIKEHEKVFTTNPYSQLISEPKKNNQIWKSIKNSDGTFSLCDDSQKKCLAVGKDPQTRKDIIVTEPFTLRNEKWKPLYEKKVR